ncbi:pentapeptide repeat-containing protein [Pseudoroseomonas cervicalis]|uniref:pentapeptide repeat-containing protein n=1 Tax=Teichococcus cervicalis TaxID=204525 RepID=UPI0027D7BEBF|nr:pentapeptide repeat-containing protein [Pseudoroseomonas cervicalis]
MLRRLALVLLGLLAAPGMAAACSCAPPRPPHESIPRTPFAFRGEIVALQQGRRDALTFVIATVRVLEDLKGDIGPSIELVQSSHDVWRRVGCGFPFPFEIGWQGLIYAEVPGEHDASAGLLPAPDRLSTNGCLMAQTYPRTGIVWQLREWRDRRRAIEAALRQSPDSPALLLERARIVESMEGPEAGAVLYRALIARDPGALAPQLALLQSLAATQWQNPSKEFPLLRLRIAALAPGDAAVESQIARARFVAREYRVARGRRDFRGWAVDSLRLDHALPGLDVSQARLGEFMLYSGDWRQARLAEAEIDNLIFEMGPLHGGIVDLRGADLTGLAVNRGSMLRARLDDARLDRVRLNRVTLHRASLRGISGQDARLEGAVMTEVDLSGARLLDADLRRADLRRAVFGQASLRHVDLREARLEGADLSEARIERSLFDGATYDDVTRWPRGVDPAALGARRQEDLASP